MKISLRIVVFTQLLVIGTCSIAKEINDPYEPVSSEVGEAQVNAFLSAYNLKQNADVRQTPKLLRLKSFFPDKDSFLAILCEKANACTAEEQSQSAIGYMLRKGDLNNDAIDEIAFVAMGQGSDLIDVILAVYQQEKDKLVLLPFQKIVTDSLGREAKNLRNTKLDQTFITLREDENYLNFEGKLLWKDANGNTIFGNKKQQANYGEISHYRYLWKDNAIQLIDTYTDVIRLKKETQKKKQPSNAK